MRSIAVVVLVGAVTGCVVVDSAESEPTCVAAEWRAYEGDPAAASGRQFFEPDGSTDPGVAQVLAGRLGPFEGDVEIQEIGVAQAPGWCPHEKGALSLALWTSAELEPEGDPNDRLEVYLTAGARVEELGNGFTMLWFAEPAAFAGGAGEVAFLGISFADAQVCTAETVGPNDGAGWRFHPSRGWFKPAGRPVIAARGCEWR